MRTDEKELDDEYVSKTAAKLEQAFMRQNFRNDKR